MTTLVQLVRWGLSGLWGDTCGAGFKKWGEFFVCERTRFHLGRHAERIRWYPWEAER